MPIWKTTDGQQASSFFLRQLSFYGVDPAQLVEPTLRPGANPEHLSLSWYPERSDVQPLRIERNHIAVFAWRRLQLQEGQCLSVNGPAQERVVLLIESLQMAPGSQLRLGMHTDLVVDLWQTGQVSQGAQVLLSGEPGGAGEDGVAGNPGNAGADPDACGAMGGYGGNANAGRRGQDSGEALISIGYLAGDVLFEVSAGTGGQGGQGGRGGTGGKAGRNPQTRKMGLGGAGGAGGAGGHGGAGGNGGHLRVWIQQMHSEAHFHGRNQAPPGGAGGHGGRAGIPGLGHPDGALGQPGIDGNAGSCGVPGRLEINVV